MEMIPNRRAAISRSATSRRCAGIWRRRGSSHRLSGWTNTRASGTASSSPRSRTAFASASASRLSVSQASQMPDWDPEEAARLLGLDDSFGPWLRHLQGLGEVPALPLLDPGEAIGLLVRLGASAGDAAEIGALLPALQQDAALWGLVERCHHDLIRAMGDENAAPFQSPHLPEHLGAIGGLFWLYVLLAAVE